MSIKIKTLWFSLSIFLIKQTVSIPFLLVSGWDKGQTPLNFQKWREAPPPILVSPIHDVYAKQLLNK